MHKFWRHHAHLVETCNKSTNVNFKYSLSVYIPRYQLQLHILRSAPLGQLPILLSLVIDMAGNALGLRARDIANLDKTTATLVPYFFVYKLGNDIGYPSLMRQRFMRVHKTA